MTDLDDELYGDLYGDDGANDFVVPTTTASDEAKQQIKSDDTPRVSTPPAPVSATSVRAETPPTQPIMTYTEDKDQRPAPIQTYSSSINTPQPIQTFSSTAGNDSYASMQDNRYKAQQGGAINGGITPLPVLERQVRPSEMKDDGKMFIGGLNWDTTDEGLKNYFEQFGRVEACTIMRDPTGRSRCFAFLTFEDPASVNAVMVREHFLDGKVIDPKRAIPRQEHVKATKLFIGGLPPSVTSESMKDFFSQYGKVVDSTVMVDRETGRSKGFGFLSFEGADVDPILGFGKVEIDGKLIDVKLAQPRHQRDNGQQDGGGSDYTPQSQGGYQNRNNNYGGGGMQNQMGTPTPMAGATAAGGTPFDPQALAQLYTRMFQQFGTGGGAGMGMMGANPMAGMSAGMGAMGGGMAGMGAMGGMSPVGRMGGGIGMGIAGAPGVGGGQGMVGGQMGGAGGMMGARGPLNAPRGPRGAGAPTGPGVQRTQRSHNYHPYSR